MTDPGTGWKKWISFTRGDRIATLVIIVLFMVSCLIILQQASRSERALPDTALLDSLAAMIRDSVPGELQASGQAYPEIKQDDFPEAHPDESKKVTCNNPNEMTFGDWYALGLPVFLIRTILHYREAGGGFYQVTDLRKIYGMNDSIFNAISAWIEIPDSLAKRHSYSAGGQGYALSSLDINHADSIAWTMLPGIGPVLAGRIIRFRELLGGFFSPGQLREVYGISDSVYRTIAPYLNTDSTGIKKINLNRCSFSELNHHPYISAYTARAILAYRTYKGSIRSTNELVQERIMNISQYKRVEHYLCIH